jgi:hypothetical protein
MELFPDSYIILLDPLKQGRKFGMIDKHFHIRLISKLVGGVHLERVIINKIDLTGLKDTSI